MIQLAEALPSGIEAEIYLGLVPSLIAYGTWALVGVAVVNWQR
jgi:hypothetical protein